MNVMSLLALPVVAPDLVALVTLLAVQPDAVRAVRELVGADPVDVRLSDDRRVRAGEPEVPHLLAEFLVDRLRGGLAGGRVAVGLDRVQGVVDDRILEAA